MKYYKLSPHSFTRFTSPACRKGILCYSLKLHVLLSMTQFVYLSNALSGTISQYKFDQGELVFLDETHVGHMVMPMAISQCQNFLYAAIRSEPYQLIQLRISQQTGKLRLECQQEVNESIVSLKTDSKNQWLLLFLLVIYT